MAVTSREVAERGGVSPSAVSRTYTEGASVSRKTRVKVLKAAGEPGYHPSLIASSLTTKRTRLIGLVADNFRNPVFPDVFDLFTRELQARGFRPLLVNLSGETEPGRSVDMLRQYHVDGVIVATSTLPAGFAAAFGDAGIPVIHCFGKYDPAAQVHIVGIDNMECGAMAAETLAARGYRSVMVLGGPGTATSTQDRVAGFKGAAHRLGLRLAALRHAANYSYEAGRTAMQPLLGEEGIEAVFCGDDLICMGALDAARCHGLRVPDEIGFLGSNDMTMAGWDSYNLTTIRQPVRDIILSSVDLVLAVVNDPARTPEARMFPCTLVERGGFGQAEANLCYGPGNRRFGCAGWTQCREGRGAEASLRGRRGRCADCRGRQRRIHRRPGHRQTRRPWRSGATPGAASPRPVD